MELIKIDEIKLNKKNPRIIKDFKFKKLVESIKSFPEMLELRAIVVDENNVIIGGNMRYKACLELGLTEIPVIRADKLTEEQKKEFMLKDNISFGDWDSSILEDWNNNLIFDLGLAKNIKKNSFEEEFNNIKECEYPIVPDFFEKHECFIIVCHNSIDIQFVRDFFDIDKNFISNSEDKKKMRTNVIDIENIRQKCTVK
jgi:hypothetical protein